MVKVKCLSVSPRLTVNIPVGSTNHAATGKIHFTPGAVAEMEESEALKLVALNSEITKDRKTGAITSSKPMNFIIIEETKATKGKEELKHGEDLDAMDEEPAKPAAKPAPKTAAKK